MSDSRTAMVEHEPEAEDRELRILLIEDSPLIRDRITAMLTDPGHMTVVSAASTEHDACALIDSQQYDVLLVDIELREGNGVGAIRHARRHYDEAHQPLIIVLTNYPWPAVRQRCREVGRDYFLDKMQQFPEVKALISGARRLPPHH